MTERYRKRIFNLKIRAVASDLYRKYLEGEEHIRNADLNAWNLAERFRLVKHAYAQSQFYREFYDSRGVDLSALVSESDFRHLPVVTRTDLQNSFEKIKIAGAPKRGYRKLSTSGTSGHPITVLQDKSSPLMAMQLRLLNWWGIEPSANKAFVYRYPRPFFKRVLNTLMWWPTQRIFLAGTRMDRPDLSKFIRQFRTVKPDLIQGYVDVVHELALFLLDNEIKLPPPKAVWLTAGPLSANKRKRISEAFDAPVYDQYGSMEIPYIAAECRMQNGLHILQDIVHVECVDENYRPVPVGSWGKLLITDLSNRVFPLIRYEIGDYGRLMNSECTCNLPLPLMDHVKGRLTDVLKTPSGLRIKSDFLGSVFDEYPNSVRSYQFYQAKDFSVELYYVKNNGHIEDSVIPRVVEKIRSESNGEISITPREVSTIMDINGKVPLIILEGN